VFSCNIDLKTIEEVFAHHHPCVMSFSESHRYNASDSSLNPLNGVAIRFGTETEVLIKQGLDVAVSISKKFAPGGHTKLNTSSRSTNQNLILAETADMINENSTPTSCDDGKKTSKYSRWRIELDTSLMEDDRYCELDKLSGFFDLTDLCASRN
jgi:hypothetical protein